jgi:lambda family phage portal protein
MSTPNMRITGQRADGKMKLRGTGWDTGNDYRNIGIRGQGDMTFTPPVRSAQTESDQYRDKGLRNARDSERNSELVRGALDRKSNTVVGPDLRPNPAPDIVWLNQDTDWMLEYQQSASSAFQEWANDLFCRNDAEGHYNFGGLMWQGFRTLAGPDAEVLGYIGHDRERADRLGAKWGTFVHLLDPDRLSTPNWYVEGSKREDQPRIIKGREVDEHGYWSALHVHVGHPGDAGEQRWEKIPRMTDHGRPMGLHWFFKRRAGLQRAITTLAAVLSTVDMLSQHSKASLQTAVSHSYLAAYLKTTMSPEQAAAHMRPSSENGVDENGNPLSEYDLKLDAYDELDLKFGNKRLPILGPNDELKFESLEGSAIDYDPFRNAFLRELASALNISFEQLSLNFSLSSYSSTRSALLEAWKQITFERTMFTKHFASLIYDAVIEEAFALGILVEPRGAPAFYEARQAYTRCTWTGPGMGWVDPLKEIEATKGRMGAGVSTLQRESSSQGGNWVEDILQRSVEGKFAAKHGVVLDTGATAATQANDDSDAADAADVAAQKERDNA